MRQMDSRSRSRSPDAAIERLGRSSGIFNATEYVVQLFSEHGSLGEVRWPSIRSRLRGKLEESGQIDDVERLILVTVEYICIAQQAASDMRMVDTMRNIYRARNTLLKLKPLLWRDEVRRESYHALRCLWLITREKTALYFMPSLTAGVTGFCGLPSCTEGSSSSNDENNAQFTAFGAVSPLSEGPEKIAVKEFLDEVVGRDGLIAIAILWHRTNAAHDHRGFRVPEEILGDETSKSPHRDGLYMWPALLVHPSSAFPRLRRIWPAIVSFLQISESGDPSRHATRTGKRLSDPVLGLTFYTTSLEQRHFAVAVSDDTKGTSNPDSHITSILAELKAIVSGSKEVANLLHPKTQRQWLENVIDLVTKRDNWL